MPIHQVHVSFPLTAAAMAQNEHHMSETRVFFFFLCLLEEGSLQHHSSHYYNMSPSRDCRYIWKSFFAIYIHIHTYYPSITLVWITDLAIGHARSKNGEWVWFCFRFHWLRI